MDIGAAYGAITKQALHKGATIIANDIEKKHLDILKQNTPVYLRNRLTLKPGKFPADLRIELNSLGGVLLSQVLHFMTAKEIETGVSLLFEWLKPGGKVFAITSTPYIKPFKNFIPVYEKRKINGELWPGIIENILVYQPKNLKYKVPKYIHFLDDDICYRVFEKAGFIVEVVEMFDRIYTPEFLKYDGRENVGIIARKPS